MMSSTVSLSQRLDVTATDVPQWSVQDQFGESVHRRPAGPLGAVAPFGGQHSCVHHRVERLDQRQIRWCSGSSVLLVRAPGEIGSEKSHREPPRLIQREFDVANTDRSQPITRLRLS